MKAKLFIIMSLLMSVSLAAKQNPYPRAGDIVSVQDTLEMDGVNDSIEIKSSQKVLNQESIHYTNSYRVNIYEVKIVTSLKEEVRYRESCTEVSASEKGDWKGLYSDELLTRSERAAALQAAILGVGEKSARLLVDYFPRRERPKTWSAFLDRINLAENENPKELSGLYARVTSDNNYRRNKKNLGFEVLGSECVQIPYETVLVHEQKKSPKVLVKQIDLKVDFDINNIILGTNESLRLDFSINMDSEYDFIVDVAAKPHYGSNHKIMRIKSSLNEPNTELKVQLDLERIKTYPRNTVEIKLYDNNKSQASIVILDKESGLDSLSGDLQVIVELVKDDWWSFNKTLETKVINFEKGQSVVEYTFNTNLSGSDAFVKYSISRSNSLIYNVGKTGEQKTKTIEIK